MKREIKELLKKAKDFDIKITFIGHTPVEGVFGPQPIDSNHMGIDLRWTDEIIYNNLKEKIEFFEGKNQPRSAWVEAEYNKLCNNSYGVLSDKELRDEEKKFPSIVFSKLSNTHKRYVLLFAETCMQKLLTKKSSTSDFGEISSYDLFRIREILEYYKKVLNYKHMNPL